MNAKELKELIEGAARDAAKGALEEAMKEIDRKIKPENFRGRELKPETDEGKFKTFGQFIKAVYRADMGLGVHPLLAEPQEKAMAEGGDGTTGGHLVPEEHRAEIIRVVKERSIVRSRARIFPMASDTLNIPVLNQSASEFGGVRSYWIGEGSVKTETAPVFDRAQLVAKKLVTLIVASDELLQDARPELDQFLFSLVGEEIAYREDVAFLDGSGSGEPQGIIGASGVLTVTRNTANDVKYADLANMVAKLAADVLDPVWIISNVADASGKSAWGQILKLTDNDGLPIFQNVPAATPRTLMGLPYYVTKKTKALGTAGDLILGDLRYYGVGDRLRMQVAVSIHDRFRYDETTFRFVQRVDGRPLAAYAFVKFA